MGDVAMLHPLLKAFGEQYPGVRLTLVSRSFFKPFFEDLQHVRFFAPDLKGRHKGLKGLWQLKNELLGQDSFDAVADMHDVLRSKVLRFLFRASGLPCAHIDKGRKQKKALVRKENKVRQPLRHSIDRYAQVFADLGFPVHLSYQLPEGRQTTASLIDQLPQTASRRVALAPFAFHRGKQYPLEKIQKLIPMLHKAFDADIYLFGGGKEEVRQLEALSRELDFVHNLAGKYSLPEELELLSQMEVMISMDSSNMHMASLCGVPVVSIWGQTHHYAGFLGYGQSPEHIVEIDPEQLSCRPCSVFGNKPCFRGDYACMNWIEEEQIIRKVAEVLD